MPKTATTADVIAEIAKALELPPGSVNEESQAEDVNGWDSMGHLSILVGLDKFFDGRIADIREMSEATSVPKILSILKQHSLL